jgi:hypothetical protein
VSDVIGEICVDGAQIADGDESRYWAAAAVGASGTTLTRLRVL